LRGIAFYLPFTTFSFIFNIYGFPKR